MSSSDSHLLSLLTRAKSSKPTRIRVLGVGSAGSQFVERMRELGLEGVDHVLVDTDLEALERSSATDKILITPKVHVGMGSEEQAHEGALAALRAKSEIARAIKHADVVFLTTALGGSTGAGASPVIGEIAQEQGALVLPVVTVPFEFEDSEKMLLAERGGYELKSRLESPVIVSSVASQRRVSREAAYQNASRALSHGVRDIVEIIAGRRPFDIDISDIRSVLRTGEVCFMAVGHSQSRNTTRLAVAQALSRLPRSVIEEARETLVHISASNELTQQAVDQVVNSVRAVAPKSRIICGVTIDPSLHEPLQVILFAGGLPGNPIIPKPRPRKAIQTR
jgi:cell division protein FtsZ